MINYFATWLFHASIIMKFKYCTTGTIHLDFYTVDILQSYWIYVRKVIKILYLQWYDHVYII